MLNCKVNFFLLEINIFMPQMKSIERYRFSVVSAEVRFFAGLKLFFSWPIVHLLR